jgi:hypothetical protein
MSHATLSELQVCALIRPFRLPRRSPGHKLSSLETRYSKAQPKPSIASPSKPPSKSVSPSTPLISRADEEATTDTARIPPTDVNRRFDVVNRGLSGYNTSQALKALPHIFVPPTDGGPKIQYLVRLASMPYKAG